MAKTTVTIKGIDKRIWLDFRARCVKDGQTVGEKLNKLMNQKKED